MSNDPHSHRAIAVVLQILRQNKERDISDRITAQATFGSGCHASASFDLFPPTY
ncbi:MAG: hypothetical protein AB3A66_08685 [Nodularia sp. CChRGM 3473]